MMSGVDQSSSNDEKVKFFLALFVGRGDVFARRFDNAKTGKKGYSPYCENQWVHGLCGLMRGIKCADCPNRKMLPVSEEVVRWHLRGKDSRQKPFEMGAYPMAKDETVKFAVMDFDKSSWRRDALFVVGKVRELGLPVALERSRSGKGAHIWFFFSESISARMARAALSYIITLTLESHPEISLDSYDRIIPNQATLPKGGFGNLIALPLQFEARKVDNSCFVNDDWVPYRDQWAFLSSIRRLTKTEVAALVERSKSENRSLIEVGSAVRDEDRPWTFFLPLWSTLIPDNRPSPGEAIPIEVVLANRVYISQEGLTDELRSRLIRSASFANPEFYEAERMRFSVYGKPRIISRALNGGKFLDLPRGCLDSAVQILKESGLRAAIDDKRYCGAPLLAEFHGELRPEQKVAAADILKHDTGILAAGTAFGKTVVAIAVIAKRKTNTLILANRRPLQMQWISKIAAFLDVPEKEIGKIGGGSGRWTGKIDVALMQSLCRKGVVDPRVKEYGQIIVDECHAVAAETFEAIVDAAPSRYVLGLSATVMRRDGHDPLIMMQLGPIRHRVEPKSLAKREPFAHVIHVRQTSFRMKASLPEDDGRFCYDGMLKEMIADAARNRLIAEDVIAAVKEGRSPVILTERREHVAVFESLLEGRVKNVVSLTGGMGAKATRERKEGLAAIADSEERVIIATGSYLGEGFDDSRLDTLFLASPVSWRGKITQYAGRLHRLHDGKREVRIYDYLDSNVSVCEKMFEKRKSGYQAIGYSMTVPLGATEGWPAEVRLPVEPKWKERFSDSVRRLCRDGVDIALADLFLSATLALCSERGADATSPGAKEAALKFLLARLDSLEGGRRLFARNVRLPIPCGANPYLEVDVWSEKNNLAIMLDTSESMSDISLYRLARHEDALLQRKGCRILRFLVEDVCERLDAVLGEIDMPCLACHAPPAITLKYGAGHIVGTAISRLSD